MENRKLSRSKKIIFSLIIVLFPLFIVLLIGELVLRIYPAPVSDIIPIAPYDSRELDDTLGWKVKANYAYDGSTTDLKGNTYPIHLTFNKNGFRAFPTHTDSNRLKIFIVGDSYTEAVEVSDSLTWYGMLQRELPADLYAYGAAGYGTMQEFMILQHYFEMIKPDIVILQMCTNDFADNYCKLERETNYKVGQKRPYMSEAGELFYDRAWLPHKHVREYSYFLYYLAIKYDMLKEKFTGKPAHPFNGEQQIVDQLMNYEPFRNSAQVTDITIKKLSEYLDGKATCLAFVSDPYDPPSSTFRDICMKHNIQFVDGVSYFVRQHQEQGEVVHSADGFHWNENGHRIVADIIKEKLVPLLNDKKHTAEQPADSTKFISH